MWTQAEARVECVLRSGAAATATGDAGGVVEIPATIGGVAVTTISCSPYTVVPEKAVILIFQSPMSLA